jgi:hypothetical protein
VKRNNMFMPKMWRNEISKIVTRLRQNPGQTSGDANDFKYTNRVYQTKLILFTRVKLITITVAKII